MDSVSIQNQDHNPSPYSFKNIRTLIIVVLLALSIPLVLFLINRVQETRSHATVDTTYEAESGTINEPAIVGNDTTASGGQYVQFGP